MSPSNTKDRSLFSEGKTPSISEGKTPSISEGKTPSTRWSQTPRVEVIEDLNTGEVFYVYQQRNVVNDVIDDLD
jgi:hypothetical protein